MFCTACCTASTLCPISSREVTSNRPKPEADSNKRNVLWGHREHEHEKGCHV